MRTELSISPEELVQILESVALYNGHVAEEIIFRDEKGASITVPEVRIVTHAKPLTVRLSENDERGLNGVLAQVRSSYGTIGGGSGNRSNGGGGSKEGTPMGQTTG